MFRRRSTSLFLVISWLALTLCLGITIDHIDDLVFEEAEVIVEVDTAAEEVENLDEHLLLRSARTDVSAAQVITPAQHAASDTHSISAQLVTASARLASIGHHPPLRSSPVSFTVPLRI